MRRRTLPTLRDAIEWLADVWSTRDTPVRLHARDTGDDGAPRFAPAFARYIQASPFDVGPVTSQRICRHVRHDGPEWECPDCNGTGTYAMTQDQWLYPMWRAMVQLRADKRAHHDAVLTLVINAFDIAGACRVLGITEAAMLAAIRSLHSRYSLAPEQRVGWVSKSESQQQAEMVMA